MLLLSRSGGAKAAEKLVLGPQRRHKKPKDRALQWPGLPGRGSLNNHALNSPPL
jgi:hypothetical protein